MINPYVVMLFPYVVTIYVPFVVKLFPYVVTIYGQF
jgi:hypothetical protein